MYRSILGDFARCRIGLSVSGLYLGKVVNATETSATETSAIETNAIDL